MAAILSHPLRPLPLYLALLSALPSLAQATGELPRNTPMELATATQLAPTRLGEVVITATSDKALPGSSTELDTRTLQQRRAASSDTARLLQDVPGVSLYGAGGVSSLPAIRGLADDRVRTKVDGMDLISSCPNHMNPALSYLDPNNLASLKVYAGVSPVSLGGDSIAGTIAADTGAAQFSDNDQLLLKGEVGVHARSNNRARGGHIAATIANQNFSLAYHSAVARADNYRAGGNFKTSHATGVAGHTLPLDEVGSSAYDTRNHSLTLAMKQERHLLELRLGYQDMPLQLYPNQRMDLLDNRQHRANLRYQGEFDWGVLEARLYRETVDHRMDFGSDKRYWYGSLSGSGSPCSPIRYSGDPAGTCAAGMPMYSSGKTHGASLKAELDLGNQSLLRLGSELQRYQLDDWWPPSGGGMGPGTFWNVRDGERERHAIYAEWEHSFNTQWQSLIGVRHEQVSTDAGLAMGYSNAPMAMGRQTQEAAAFNGQTHDRRDHNWDFSWLARYTASEQFALELGLARKVRSPNLYERYTWSSWPMAATMNNYVGDGNGYVGNPDLQPEIAHTLSATFDWHSVDRRHSLTLTPYYTQVRDYIDAIALPGFAANKFNVLRYTNQSARLYGIDIAGQLPLATTPYGRFDLQASLSLLHGRNRTRDDHLYNIQPAQLRLALNHNQGAWDNRLEFVAVASKDKVSYVRNEIPTAGHALMNLRSSYHWEQLRLDVGIDNLFDRRYALPLGGAYLGQGTTMSMNGIPWGIAVPGMGRSFYVAGTYKF